MIRIRILFLAIILSTIIISCSPETNSINPDMSEGVSAAIEQNNQSTGTHLPTRIQTEQTRSATPGMATHTATIQATATVTETTRPTATANIPVACPETEGYTWSRVFSEDTCCTMAIYPAADGNFLISGTLDANDGTWVAKIDPDGALIWQKKFSKSYADLQPAPNGNYLLEFRNRTIELDTDGNVVKSMDQRMQPNVDGSYTVIDGSRVMRYSGPDSLQWSYAIDNDDIYGELTTDGGAIYAYAGSYADKSVYWMPIYTDIKVIKIDGRGQVSQRVYGKLIGNETFDYLGITDDGGAILGGTHTYEELGSDYDIWLMKINQSGGISWQSSLKLAPTMESISHLYILSKGYLVVSEDYVNDSLHLVKLTQSGDISWQKQVSSVRGNITILTVADTYDGGLIISGQTNEIKEVGFLARFSPKGELLWEKLTGFSRIGETPDSIVATIYPLNDDNILVGGVTNIIGQGLSDVSSAWLANIKDEGEVLGFLNIVPGRFSVVHAMTSRPNNLPDEVVESDPIKVTHIVPKVQETTYQAFPACLSHGVNWPTPRALSPIVPSLTPTPRLMRNLYLTKPNYMQGEDVLMVQQRLLELGYDVGVADGIFGKKTEAAVRLFQEKNGLEVDGWVGLFTWKKLFSDSAIPNF